MPDPVKYLRYIKSNEVRLPKVPNTGRLYMCNTRNWMISRSCLMETILLIRKKEVRFKVFEEITVKVRFKDFSHSRG